MNSYSKPYKWCVNCKHFKNDQRYGSATAMNDRCVSCLTGATDKPLYEEN